MASLDIEKYSWIIRGKQRRDIIKHIDGPESPTQIAQKSKYSLNHTSRILNELSRKSLAKCLNPEQKTGRLYVLTEQGKVIRDKLRKETI